MARYRVQSLNYMTAGGDNVFINASIVHSGDQENLDKYILKREDSESDVVVSGNIVTEQKTGEYITSISGGVIAKNPIPQDGISSVFNANSKNSGILGLSVQESQRYEEDEEGYRSFLEIPKEIPKITEQDIIDYNNKISDDNFTLVINVNNEENGVNEISGLTPAYDMQDICVKSDNHVSKSNLRTFDYRKSEDFYVPQMERQSKQFCGIGNTAYFLSENTNLNIQMNKSSVFDSRNKGNYSSTCSMSIESDKNKVYLYKDKTQITSNPYDPDFGEKDVFSGILHNYIYTINRTDDTDDSNGRYVDGNIYGKIYKTKNAYDSKYDVNAISRDELNNCRRYIGIGTQSQNLYLKFYDDVDYLKNEKGELSTRIHDKLPFQKVESFNDTTLTNTSRHKSNFFSIKVRETVYSDKDDSELSEKYVKIKKNIVNAIREIAENICPANTQLFDVKFTEI